ncbi:hypothetical protein LMG33810_000095 [Carnimonas sp. LMG 33810]
MTAKGTKEHIWTGNNTMDISQGQWLNRPSQWRIDQQQLVVVTDEGTDFWRKTHYGFVRHSGHAFGQQISGDFTLQLCVEANFEQLYDQAGLFIQHSAHDWVKAGIEYNDDAPAMSCVVTRDHSDWSTGVFSGNPRRFWMRATCTDDVLRIQYSDDGKTWPLLRLLDWSSKQPAFVGAMCCTPERGGLEVVFSELQLGPPLEKELHDLS